MLTVTGGRLLHQQTAPSFPGPFGPFRIIPVPIRRGSAALHEQVAELLDLMRL